MDTRAEGTCIDTETGEIIYPSVSPYNAETGEYEALPSFKQRIKFRVAVPEIQEKTKRSCRPCLRLRVDKRELELITAAIFLLPTMILFHPVVSIFIGLIEMVLHNWAHRKNQRLRDSKIYYKSPLHGITKEFCGRCKDHTAKEKITKIQDMRNNDKMKSLEYIRRVVN